MSGLGVVGVGGSSGVEFGSFVVLQISGSWYLWWVTGGSLGVGGVAIKKGTV